MPSLYDRSESNDKLIFHFHSIGKILHRISEGRESQQRILTTLRETGIISQSKLTQRMGIQPGSASENREAGKRGTDSSDAQFFHRRTLNITLTPAGQTRMEEVLALWGQRHGARLSCLSEEEKANLLYLLQRISEDWAARYPRRIAR